MPPDQGKPEPLIPYLRRKSPSKTAGQGLSPLLRFFRRPVDLVPSLPTAVSHRPVGFRPNRANRTPPTRKGDPHPYAATSVALHNAGRWVLWTATTNPRVMEPPQCGSIRWAHTFWTTATPAQRMEQAVHHPVTCGYYLNTFGITANSVQFCPRQARSRLTVLTSTDTTVSGILAIVAILSRDRPPRAHGV
jgi:hypothetical protein